MYIILLFPVPLGSSKSISKNLSWCLLLHQTKVDLEATPYNNSGRGKNIKKYLS
jgi:hypothetical protein